MSGSAVAELANWAIDEGHAPRWYDRSLKPTEKGEFRPRFDYVAADRAPVLMMDEPQKFNDTVLAFLKKNKLIKN